MPIKERAKHILVELRRHAPFTLLGAGLGIIFMLIFANLGPTKGRTLFAIFHPTHVVLSAMVTASMFKLHSANRRIVYVIIVGYLGSIGIATLSDIIIPHAGSRILHLDIPTHAELHELSHSEPESSPDENGHVHEQGWHDEHLETRHAEHHHSHSDHKIHFGFIDEWYMVNPAAFLGILIALFLPRTKFPHSAHVLISTWASSSYLLMHLEADLTAATVAGAFAVLFLAVWLPCCISDIIFPLLLVNSDLESAARCSEHSLHSRRDTQAPQQEKRQ